MLTYRTGAANAPSAARSMAADLLHQTLPPEMAAMAEYYEQGAPPPTAAEAAAGRYGHRADGASLAGKALDDVLAEEHERLSENEGATAEPADRSWSYRALGALLAARLVTRAEALAALERAGAVADAERVDQAAKDAD